MDNYYLTDSILVEQDNEELKMSSRLLDYILVDAFNWNT